MQLMRGLAGAIVGLLVFVVGTVVVAPNMVVRLVATRAAAWAGIETSGLETLDVDLTNATISGGPLTFGRGSFEPARVGRFRLDVDGSRLIAARLSVEDVSVTDVNLKLVVAGDGSYVLDGIPLGREPLPDEATGPKMAKASADEMPPLPRVSIRQASIERLHVDITRAPDQSLPITIEHFRLSDLSPEAPEVPSTFELAGGAGHGRFNYRGEAKVFRYPIDIIIDGGFEDLPIAEIEALARPFGPTRREGTVALTGRHHVNLSRTGDVLVTTVGCLTATGVDVAAPSSIAVRLDRGTFALDTWAKVASDGRAELRNRGPFDISGLVVSWSQKGSVALAEVTVDVETTASLKADQSMNVTLAGSVPLTDLVVSWSESGAVYIDGATADVDLNVGRKPDGSMMIAGPMAVNGGTGGIRSGRSFKLSYKEIDAVYPDAVINLASDGTAAVNGKPRATLTGFALDAPLKVDAASAVATSGWLHVLAPSEGVLVEYEGALDLKAADIPLDETSRLRLTTLESQVANFRYDEEPSFAADLHSDVAVRAFGVSKEAKGKAASFPLRDGAATLAGLDLKLTPEGGVHHLALAPTTRVVLEGSARGRPHHLTVGLERFQITDLDPSIPDQLSRAEIVAVVNGLGRIELTEEVKPFAIPPEFVFDGSIRDLELPDLSPYVAAATGLEVESGRLAAAGNAIASAGKLDGIVNVDVQTLDLVPASNDPVADLLGVPVDLAVALLEDANRRIKVSLPFSGDLSSPKVDYCDAIRTALLGAVRLVVTAPFQGGGNSTATGALETVPFKAGQATPTAEGARQLEKMADLLSEKKRLRLQVCGRATSADAVALGGATRAGGQAAAAAGLSEKMLALTQERGRIALEVLDAAARRGQVQACRSTADEQDAGPPRVEARF